MTVYNKLVRDRIPEIMTANGAKFRVRKLEPEERLAALRNKLLEELAESIAAVGHEEALEELADISEVLLALAAEHGATPDELEVVRARKASKRGGFELGWFLVETSDEVPT